MTEHPQLVSVGRALPPHRYAQADLAAALAAFWASTSDAPVPARLGRMHQAVAVDARHLALPLEAYPGLTDFGASNDAFIAVGADLAERVVAAALAEAGLAPADVDAVLFTTVTGLATPTLDARLMNRLGLRRDVKRWPFFGLGCVGGAAGVARMSDYLRGDPDAVAVLLSVELCSLTLQRDDRSVRNLIATALFGDGAACVVGLGARRAAQRAEDGKPGGPTVLASRSCFYPDSERVMGWDIGAQGFKLVLSAGVPQVVETWLGADVDAFLADHGLHRHDIGAWICHPGGPKVVDAVQAALDLAPDDLALTRASLAEVGNLSSASVLCVLEDFWRTRRPAPGTPAVLLAMGPGFCAELVLLRW